MSKKKRNIERAKKDKARSIRKREKEKRQRNDPVKWEEKKAKKRAIHQRVRDSQYPNINANCELAVYRVPSPENCEGCNLLCQYNNN